MVYPHAASVPSVYPFSCHIQLWSERSGGLGEKGHEDGCVIEEGRETERQLEKEERQRQRDRGMRLR